MRELLAPDDTRDALRKQGGLLLALGVLMLVLRKEDDLSDFVTFLLYGASTRTAPARGRPCTASSA